MRVIAFLAIVMLVSILAGVHKSKYARITIGSIFGLAFFAVWPFLFYTAQLLQWPEFTTEIVFTITCAISVAGTFWLLKIKPAEIVAAAAFFVFVITIMVSWSFDIAIKHQIDDYIYLTPAPASYSNDAVSPQPVTTFSHPSGGYTIDVPSSWKRQDDLGMQFIYFQETDGKSTDVELRPMCLDKNATTLGQVVINIRAEANNIHSVVEIACHKLPGDKSSCSVMYKGRNGELVKLSQFGFSEAMRKGYNLDFILHTPGKKTVRQIERVIASIRPSPQQDNLQECLGLSAWF